jgi:hypothetical protein
METLINNKLIRSFSPYYDPSEIGISDDESLAIKKWIEKYRNVVKNKEDIIWLICRPELMSDKNCRLFAVWCARKSFEGLTNIDPRSIEACNVTERYANGNATNDELLAARSATWSAAWSAAWSATRSEAGSAQIDQLLTYFK